MRDHRQLALLAAICCASLAACTSTNTEKVSSEGSKGSAQTESGAPSGSPHPPMMAEGRGIVWDVPAGFHQVEPSSSMRLAEYHIPPAVEGGEEGELVVFFFGPGVGGETHANLERWAGQFAQDDASDPMKSAAVETFESAGGLRVTTIEVAGRYHQTSMGGGPETDRPGWALYGAIVEGEGGPWFLKAVGPESVIAQNRQPLHAVYKGVRLADL